MVMRRGSRTLETSAEIEMIPVSRFTSSGRIFVISPSGTPGRIPANRHNAK